MLLPSQPVSTTIIGHRYYIDLRDRGISQHLFLEGVWEPRETEVFVSVVKPGMVVVDVGANTGYYTLLAARAVGVTGRVYSFEPEAKNFDLLCKNVTSNGYQNVMAVPKAVLNRSGPASLYLSRGDEGSHSVGVGRAASRVVDVPAVTLDEFFAEHDCNVDVAKIDVEGAEELVLNGMTDVLARSPNIVLFTEFNPASLNAMGSSPEAFLMKLGLLGFVIHPFPAPGEQRRPPLGTRPVPEFIDSLLRYCAAADWGYVNLLCARGAALMMPFWQK